MSFHSKRAILCGFNVAGNNKTYFGLHVKCPISFPDLTKFWIFSTGFHMSPTSIFTKIRTVRASLVHVERLTDRRKDGHDEANIRLLQIDERG